MGRRSMIKEGVETLGTLRRWAVCTVIVLLLLVGCTIFIHVT